MTGRNDFRLRLDTTLLTLLLTLPCLAGAEEKEEELESIVVTAARTRNLIRDEALRVEVLPEEEVEENLTVQPGNLSTLLNELAGVQIQSTGAGLGGATLRMRGMSGRHTLVLQDGLPLLGAQTDAFGLLQTPPLDLAHVELIKGVGSAMYGGSALGGILNLVSRPAGSESELLLNRSSRGATDVVGFFSGEGSSPLGYTVIAGAHDQTLEKVDGDAWADLAEYRRYTVRPRVFWKNDEGASVFGTLGFVDEERAGGTLRGRTLADGSTFRDALDTRRVDGGLVTVLPLAGERQWGTRWSATLVDRDRTFGTVAVEDEQTTLNGETTLTGKAGKHAWVLGVAALYEELESPDAPNAEYSYLTPAVFVQDEFTANEAMTLLGSARIDKHSDYGTFFSPRFSALFRLNEAWTVRTSIGNGFAAPTPIVDEVQKTSLAVLEPLDGLRAEKATSASIDVGWSVEGLEINGSVFGSWIRDPLSVRAGDQPGRVRLVNDQQSRRVKGAELLVHYVTGDLHLLASSTFLDATEESVTGGRQDVDRVPEIAAELAAILEDEERGRLGIEFSYTGRQRLAGNPYRSAGRSYVEVSALAELKLGEVSIFLNAMNLTNVRQTRWDPLLRPTPSADGERIVDAWTQLAGRVFNLGIKLDL